MNLATISKKYLGIIHYTDSWASLTCPLAVIFYITYMLYIYIRYPRANIDLSMHFTDPGRWLVGRKSLSNPRIRFNPNKDKVPWNTFLKWHFVLRFNQLKVQSPHTLFLLFECNFKSYMQINPWYLRILYIENSTKRQNCLGFYFSPKSWFFFGNSNHIKR